MDDAPNWAKVLQTLYEDRSYIVVPAMKPSQGIEIENERYNIYSITDIPESEVWDAIVYLRKANLIRLDDKLTDALNSDENTAGGGTEIKTKVVYRLTEEGFSVVHDRGLARRQERLNKSLVAFTVILVVINAIGLYPEEAVQKIGSVLLLIGIMVLVIWGDLL